MEKGAIHLQVNEIWKTQVYVAVISCLPHALKDESLAVPSCSRACYITAIGKDCQLPTLGSMLTAAASGFTQAMKIMAKENAFPVTG